MTNLDKVHEYITRLIGRASGVRADMGKVDKEDVVTVSITYKGRFCRADASKLLSLFGGYTSEQFTATPVVQRDFTDSHPVAVRLPDEAHELIKQFASKKNISTFALACLRLYKLSAESPYEDIIKEMGDKCFPTTVASKNRVINISLKDLDDISHQAKEFRTSKSNVLSKRILWATRHTDIPSDPIEPVKSETEKAQLMLYDWITGNE